MTECPGIAYRCTQNGEEFFPRSCVIVNEMLESEKLKLKAHLTSAAGAPAGKFTSFVHVESPQPAGGEYNREMGRRCRRHPMNSASVFNEFVARHSVTIPRYLVVFQSQV